jgi:hypothetical protein
MRKLGRMEHDECAPWCNHEPEDHADDCTNSFCDGYECKTLRRIMKEVKNEVRFRDLPATNAHRCSVMLENKMQCTEHAAIEVAPDGGVESQQPEGSFICKHHFAVERALNEAEGVKYIAHDMQGNRINERKEKYQPPQK